MDDSTTIGYYPYNGGFKYLMLFLTDQGVKKGRPLRIDPPPCGLSNYQARQTALIIL